MQARSSDGRACSAKRYDLCETEPRTKPCARNHHFDRLRLSSRDHMMPLIGSPFIVCTGAVENTYSPCNTTSTASRRVWSKQPNCGGRVANTDKYTTYDSPTSKTYHPECNRGIQGKLDNDSYFECLCECAIERATR